MNFAYMINMPDSSYEHITDGIIDTYIFDDGVVISISNDIGPDVV